MSYLVQFLLPAMGVSLAALLALQLARTAPPSIKLGLALVGLAAWFVPWPLLNSALVTSASIPFGEWIAESGLGLANVKRDIAIAVENTLPVAAVKHGAWWFVLFVPGLIWFLIECVSYRNTLNRWRTNSVSGRQLNSILPASLRERTVDIRVVSESKIATATGWFKPTIWIGDRCVDQVTLRVALTHESIHVRNRDPALLLLLGFAARVFWFNPLIYALKRQAILAIEARCDEECANLLGRRRYRNTLAQLVLENQEYHGLRLMPSLHVSSVDCARLMLLKAAPRMDLRGWAALIVVATACYGGAAWSALNLSADTAAVRTEIAESSRYGYDLPPQWSANTDR